MKLHKLLKVISVFVGVMFFLYGFIVFVTGVNFAGKMDVGSYLYPLASMVFGVVCLWPNKYIALSKYRVFSYVLLISLYSVGFLVVLISNLNSYDSSNTGGVVYGVLFFISLLPLLSLYLFRKDKKELKISAPPQGVPKSIVMK